MNFRLFYIIEKIPKYYEAAIKEYEKRLSRYCKVKRVGVKSEELLEKNLPSNAYIIRISEAGEAITSERLAEKIKDFAVTGKSDIAFIIGDTSSVADEHLSLSQMEMSQGLTLTVLMEQIYRGYRIINGEPYHK